MIATKERRRRTGAKRNGAPRGALPDTPQRRAQVVAEIWRLLSTARLAFLDALLSTIREHGGGLAKLAAAPRRRSAAELMDLKGKKGLAAARRRFGADLGGRDFVQVGVWCSDATGEMGAQRSDLFIRTVIAPPGSAEQVVEAADELCDAFDPAGCAQFCLSDAEEAA
jgi:hypothetical protein